jgi:aldehyde dehydrogenase (NAD+)
VDALRYYAGWTTKLQGDTIPVRGNVFNYTLREPVGVVGAIIPWNFPLLMAVWKVAPALACGNTVVLKPAEQTPLSALELAAIAARRAAARRAQRGAGLRRDGGRRPGGASGRGQDRVHRLDGGRSPDHAQAAESLKKVSLELGGKSPNIVLADADVAAAARGAFSAIFYNTGQCCTAGSRLLVHESVKDQLLQQLVDRAKSCSRAIPSIRRRGSARWSRRSSWSACSATSRRAAPRARGAGGRRARALRRRERGFWVQPTVFDGVAEDTASPVRRSSGRCCPS